MRRRVRYLLPLIVASAFAATSLSAAPREGVPRAEVPEVGQIGGPVPGLDAAETARWLAGRALFDRDFHRATGLGAPDYNADSCRACHQDPVLGGSGGLELNVSRFGNDNGGLGPFTNVPGGQVLHKFRFPDRNDREEHDLATADVFEQRQTPALFGLGRIEAIPAARILANEDPTDADMDGVFGVARLVDTGGAALEVGRFGWKAQIPTLEDFVRDAAGVESGLTTPDDGRGFALAVDGDVAPDPEVPQAEIDDLVFFMRNLAPPLRTGSQAADVLQGEQLFAQVGCADCHVPSLLDDQDQPVFLYSDLLLHRVMPSSFRGMAEEGAPAGFYRTPPLWGIRHSAPYMHDGRAETLRDAIFAHDGEAMASRLEFGLLPVEQQQALVLFLEDL